MARLVDFNIGGRTMRLNYSVAAAENGASKADFEEFDAMNSSDPDKGMSKMLSIFFVLAEQGKRYCDLIGEPCDSVFSLDELKVLAPRSGAGAQALADAVFAAIRSGQAQTVDVEEDPKNGATTPEEAAG